MTIHDMLANLEFTEDKESGGGYVVEGLPQSSEGQRQPAHPTMTSAFFRSQVGLLLCCGFREQLAGSDRFFWVQPPSVAPTAGMLKATTSALMMKFAECSLINLISRQTVQSSNIFQWMILIPSASPNIAIGSRPELLGTHGSAKMIGCCWRSWVGGE
jgi:hypothetical protein